MRSAHEGIAPYRIMGEGEALLTLTTVHCPLNTNNRQQLID